MCVCVCVCIEGQRKTLGILYHSPSHVFETGSLSECEAPVVHLGWQPASLSDLPVSAPHPTVLELKQHSDHIHLMWVLDMNSDPHDWAANSLSH